MFFDYICVSLHVLNFFFKNRKEPQNYPVFIEPITSFSHYKFALYEFYFLMISSTLIDFIDFFFILKIDKKYIFVAIENSILCQQQEKNAVLRRTRERGIKEKKISINRYRSHPRPHFFLFLEFRLVIRSKVHKETCLF